MMPRNYDLKCLFIVFFCLLGIYCLLCMMGCATALKNAQIAVDHAEVICEEAPAIIDGLYKVGDINLQKKHEYTIKLNQYCSYIAILKLHLDMYTSEDEEQLENTLFNMEQLKEDLKKQPFFKRNL
jgi:hypothetical protein